MTRNLPPELLLDLEKHARLSKLKDLKTFEQTMKTQTEINAKFELRDSEMSRKEHISLFLFVLITGIASAVFLIVTFFFRKDIDNYLTRNPTLIVFIVFAIPILVTWVKFGKEVKKWVGVRIIKWKAR